MSPKKENTWNNKEEEYLFSSSPNMSIISVLLSIKYSVTKMYFYK